MMQSKQQLRVEWSLKRDAIAADLHHALSARIVQQLVRYPKVIHSKKVALYAPMKSEVDILPAFALLQTLGIGVCFPRVEKTFLAFVEIDTLEQLKPGTFGILEPQGKALDLVELDTMIVPGVAFDKRGARLGYGAGFYDRTLSGFAGFSLGVTFKSQVLDKLPLARHDCLLNEILTEEGPLFIEG